VYSVTPTEAGHGGAVSVAVAVAVDVSGERGRVEGPRTLAAAQRHGPAFDAQHVAQACAAALDDDFPDSEARAVATRVVVSPRQERA